VCCDTSILLLHSALHRLVGVSSQRRRYEFCSSGRRIRLLLSFRD